jgi:hypothetical protein
MILYRDCGSGNATLPGGTVPLNSNSPAGTITLTQVGVNTDVSPTCYVTPSPIRCNISASGEGALEEARYESAFINLTGTPPAGGWQFSYSLCCRPNTLTNLTNPGSQNLFLRAVMYPYSITGTPQNTNPCYDSSPRFLEPPKSVICMGYENSYGQFAFDDDLDSIYYDWAPLLSSAGSPISYVSPYTFSSPLPNGGTPAQLNNVTGNITLNASAGGSYATSIRISAYRCGQLIAMVFRDIPMVIKNDCPNLPTGSPNTPPTLAVANIPGFQGVTPVIVNGDTAYYEATVFAGQQVRFNLVSQDPDFLPNFLPQTIGFTPSGGQFGVPLSNAVTGCLNPPCATVTPVSPQTSLVNPLNNEVLFNWQTTCDHVSSLNVNCSPPSTQYSTQYNFNLRMQDNFCPIPATKMKNIVINVLTPTIGTPDTVYTNIISSSNIEVIWAAPLDTSTNFNGYELSFAPSIIGPYTVIDTIINYSQTQYSLDPSQLGSGFIRIKTLGPCGLSSPPTAAIPIQNCHPTIITDLNTTDTIYATQTTKYLYVITPNCINSFQWQLNPYNQTGWLNLQDGNLYSGTSTSLLLMSGLDSTFNGNKYRVLLSGSGVVDTSNSTTLYFVNNLEIFSYLRQVIYLTPNPTNGIVSLNTSVVGNYELLTLDGRVLESGTAKKDYDLTKYPKGVYHLRLSTDEGTRVLKVVKN